MHCAPSVSYPVGRSRNAGRLLLALWSLGAFAVVLACAQAPGIGWRGGLLAASAIAAAAAARIGWSRHTEAAELNFDGRYWSISGSARRRAAAAWVGFDLQSLVLARLDEPGEAARWVWLDREAAPARWDDLRRALHARPVPAEPASAEPAPARSPPP